MKVKRKFYVTTPLYYPNDIPHIGHAYTTIAVDVLARYKRLAGFDVFFLTGTDEHGEKIQTEAKKAGYKPKQFVDKFIPRYKKIWKALNLSYDYFIRTTDKKHEEIVKKILNKVYKKGEIYKGEYEGWYCVPCETYWTKLQLEGGNCPSCKRPVKKLREPTYFFKMSKYQKPLLAHYKKNPKFIQPNSRRNEIVNRVKEGLRDLSISRTSFDWGISLPWDKKHVTYVWFDALTNYISALDWPNGQKFKKYWPADVHIIGKDILWFHTVIWPAMLLSAGVKLPKQIFAHGWWTVEGEKMSKSKGNVINPYEASKKYGVDTLRYFLLREIPFGEDGDFSKKALIKRNNDELANDLGNLLSRSVAMVEKYCGSKVPKGKSDAKLSKLAEQTRKDVEKQMDALQFHSALQTIWKFINVANKYVQHNKPWTKPKNLNDILYNLIESLRFISNFVYPFMPSTAEEVAKQIGVKIPKKLKWGELKAGTKVKKGRRLFEKII